MNPSEMTLLMTRPAPASARFAEVAQRAFGRFGQVVVSPVLEIVPLGSVPAVPEGAALAFTSENAVGVAAAHLDAAGRRAWCVGDRTADAARRAGFDAESAGGDAAALAQMMLRDRPEGEILHLSGVHQAGDLVERLRAKGLDARRMAIYDQRPLALSGAARAALRGARPVMLPLFSPRSAATVRSDLADMERAGTIAAPLLTAFLSPAVAAAWDGHPGGPEGRTAVSASPDAAGMVAALARLIGDAA